MIYIFILLVFKVLDYLIIVVEVFRNLYFIIKEYFFYNYMICIYYTSNFYNK